MGVIPAIRSMAEGQPKVFLSLGGNRASAAPDTDYVERALKRCRLTVMISTKLNRNHLVTGKQALILPCLSRSDEDNYHGVNQSVTIEDALGRVGFSAGCLHPASPTMKSEISIISEMARAVLGDHHGIDWKRFGHDYQFIMSTMSKIIPAFRELNKHSVAKSGFYIENPLRKGVFNTSDMKAQFSDHKLEMAVPGQGELMLMTIRSHDQFNTSIFGLNDRYRGIRNERRLLFMNREDMDARKIAPGQLVDITSHYENKTRKLEGYFAIPYKIRKSCVAAYFPETNVLIPISNPGKSCGTPAYKSVRVKVVPGGYR
jgi:anaerobic selenocysteine-containing dehydrogenase